MKVETLKRHARSTVGTMVKRRPDAALAFTFIFAHRSCGSPLWRGLLEQGAQPVGEFLLTVGDRSAALAMVADFPRDKVAVLLCGSDGQCLCPFDSLTGDFVPTGGGQEELLAQCVRILNGGEP